VKVKGVTERGLGQDKREMGRGEREEEKVRDTATTKFRITTPNYLPMESTTHTSTPKNIFHSTQCTVSILTLQKVIQFLTEF
jgi:hypothetical protein